MKPEIRVLAIIPSGFCFGLQKITFDFFGTFSNKVNSHFLITRWANGEFEKQLKRLNIAYTRSWLGMFSRKIDWHNIKMTYECLTKLPILYRDYLRVLRNFRPNILFFANHHELILLLPVLLLNKNIPIVCHMHDPSSAIPFQKRSFRYYSKVVDFFIVISESVLQRMIQLGCPPSKLLLLHNGIHLPENTTKERSPKFIKKFAIDNDNILVGITGQISYTKGHEDIISAIEIARKKDKRIKLIIGGKNEGNYIEEIKKIIDNKDLKEHIFFSGWLEDANKFYQAIDIFVLASRHEEGYGLVVAEAMANYRPVIATKSGGVVEIIEHQKTGYLIEKNAPFEMANRILELASNEKKRKKMGEAGRDRVERDFSLKTQTQRLEEILLRLGS